MEVASNGPAVINGVANNYDRLTCFDAPVAMDTGLYVYPTKTLVQMRADVMTRLGFAAMLGNPPPGMTDYLNSVIQDAQDQLYFRYNHLRTERWWAWQLTAGRAIYDTPIDCTKALDFRKITGAWLSDNGGRALRSFTPSVAYALGEFVNSTVPSTLEYEVTTAGTAAETEPTWPLAIGGTVVSGTVTFTARAPATATWSPMKQGIDPLQYSATQHGQPYFFDIGEYLSIWPIPDKTYVVWLRGHMGLKRLTQDDDTLTIDYTPVFLMALANAKSHYGQPDANLYFRQLEVLLGRYTAAGHGTKRYIPNPRDYASTCADLAPCGIPRATFR